MPSMHTANNHFDQQVKKVLTEKGSSAAAAAAADTDAAADTSTATSTPSGGALESTKKASEAVETDSDPTGSSAASASTEMPELYRRHRPQHGHPREGLARF